MPYTANIPQAGDLISASQSLILNNFTEISNAISVDHIGFNVADQGKHAQVTFTNIAVPGFAATEIGIYNNNASGVQELYVKKGAGAEYPFTAASAIANGWTRLPSKILIKWGNAASIPGLSTHAFPAGAGIPAFTQIFSMQITTAYVNAADGDGFVRLNNFLAPWTQFSVYGSARTTVANKAVTFQYLAIGI